MAETILYHGSQKIIETPIFGQGNPHNDYGRGFYCTEHPELAKEWACIDGNGGFANVYEIDLDALHIVNLSHGGYGILEWLALLVNHRTFRIGSPVAAQAKQYLSAHFLPDLSDCDAVIGYRADDSYFSFAMDFLSNTISLRQLERAMYLGKLGEQVMLKSRRAFECLRFVRADAADGERYYAKRISRDRAARNQYLNIERNAPPIHDELFVLDILRQEMRRDDVRLQRSLSE